MKVCSKCKTKKSLDSFHNRKSSKDGKQSSCKDCNINNVKNWQQVNPDKYEEQWKKTGTGERYNLLRRARKYGLTVNGLEILLSQANGKCEICGRKPNHFLVVDHCHKSSIVRGILSEPCNQALGLFADNVEYMEKAIEYLKKNKI